MVISAFRDGSSLCSTEVVGRASNFHVEEDTGKFNLAVSISGTKKVYLTLNQNEGHLESLTFSESSKSVVTIDLPEGVDASEALAHWISTPCHVRVGGLKYLTIGRNGEVKLISTVKKSKAFQLEYSEGE